jgi:hypothetical protein
MGKLSEADIDVVCRRYREGETGPSLAGEFGVIPATIYYHLKKKGIPSRGIEGAWRRYTCDHSFFSQIDTEEKAYWLGFIAADGCNTRDGRLLFNLATADREHLERFRRAVGSDAPIQDFSDRPHSVLCVSSRRLSQDLLRQGIPHAKTFCLQWPSLAVPLYVPFLRGYVDGDGCFGVRKEASRPSPVYSFSLTGHEPFIVECQELLMRRCGLSRTKLMYRRPGKPVATLNYRGRPQVERIASLLYESSSVYLPRKRNKVLAQLALEF